jgi:hypothetical protein
VASRQAGGDHTRAGEVGVDDAVATDISTRALRTRAPFNGAATTIADAQLLGKCSASFAF